MVDRLTKEHRSWNMSRVRAKDTGPEKAVRSCLHRSGFRFRLHRRDLPGTPDIVLPRYRTVVFVHGCFWHRHRGCQGCATPGTNTEFWEAKFRRNVTRDRAARAALRRLGWRVVVVWECEVRKPHELALRLSREVAGEERFDGGLPAELSAAESAGVYGASVGGGKCVGKKKAPSSHGGERGAGSG